MEYKFTPNLQKMSMISLGVSVWEQVHIKKKVKVFFKHNIDDVISKKKNRQLVVMWEDLIKNVIQEVIPKITLPVYIRKQLSHIIRSLGTKIYKWHVFIAEILTCNLYDYNKLSKYTGKIYWTWYGCIDEVKIFKLFWMFNLNLSNSFLYKMACHYCLQEEIKWPHQRAKLNSYFSKRSSNPETESLFPRLLDFDSFLDSQSSVLTSRVVMCRQERIFKLRVREGNVIAAKYFWNKFSSSRKAEIIVTLTQEVIEGDRVLKQPYKTDHLVEISMFLINEMTDSQKEDLFKGVCVYVYDGEAVTIALSFLKLLLCNWPFQEFFFPALNAVGTYLKHTDYKYLLCLIVNKLKIDHELGYDIENNIYHTILHTTWKKTHLLFKHNVPFCAICNLLCMYDFSSLSMIFNEFINQEHVNEEYKRHINLIIKMNYKSIDSLINQVLLCKGKEEDFREKMIILEHFFMSDKQGSASECSFPFSPREGQSICEGLNVAIIYRYYVLTSKPEVAEKILKFGFNILENCFCSIKMQL